VARRALRWIAGGLAVAWLLRRSGAPSREGWVRLTDEPGLAVRMPARSWTTPAVRDVLRVAGGLAAQLGGALQVADVGPPVRGAPYPPHRSHRWGRDIDLGYTLDVYPTPAATPVDPRVAQVLAAIAGAIEVVYAGPRRVDALEGYGFKVRTWPGHDKHLHLRLRADLASANATTEEKA